MTISNRRRALLRAVLCTVPLVAVAAAASATAGGTAGAATPGRAPPRPGAGVAAVYLVIQGGARRGSTRERQHARAPRWPRCTAVTTEAGVSRMREMSDGVVIPAGAAR